MRKGGGLYESYKSRRTPAEQIKSVGEAVRSRGKEEFLDSFYCLSSLQKRSTQ